MPSGKEIRNQIRSIQSTQKITRAMEMVATSKMQRTRRQMEDLRPYAEKLYNVALHVGEASAGYRHPYLHCPRPKSEGERHLGLIIISTDRGLCGGLNANLFRAITRFVEKNSHDHFVGLCYGRKAVGYANRINLPTVGELVNIGDKPDAQQVSDTLNKMVAHYVQGELDEVYLATNRFKSSLNQEPVILPLLPLSLLSDETKSSTPLAHWDYIYEPDPEIVMAQLMKSYIETYLYEALLENIACEMSARMVAMKSASDNATDIMDKLHITYNKIRQASITQEISEIISGAAAL